MKNWAEILEVFERNLSLNCLKPKFEPSMIFVSPRIFYCIMYYWLVYTYALLSHLYELS